MNILALLEFTRSNGIGELKIRQTFKKILFNNLLNIGIVNL